MTPEEMIKWLIDNGHGDAFLRAFCEFKQKALDAMVEELDVIVKQIQAIVESHGCYVQLYDNDRSEVTIGYWASRGYTDKQKQEGLALCAPLVSAAKLKMYAAASLADAYGLQFSIASGDTYYGNGTGGAGWNRSDSSC